MPTFLSGQLSQKIDGAYDSLTKTLFTRTLIVHLTNGLDITLFDDGSSSADEDSGTWKPLLVSDDLNVGQQYDFIVQPLGLFTALDATQSTQITSLTTQGDTLSAIIHEIDWDPGTERFQKTIPRFADWRWLVIETIYGDMILAPEALNTSYGVGTVLQWPASRFDVLAVR